MTDVGDEATGAEGGATHPFVGRQFPDPEGTGIAHTILEAGRGPSVILLHELNGVSPSVRALAHRLVASGFRVHMPVLYATEAVQGPIDTARVVWCLRRELSIFAAGRRSPLSDWLRALADDIAAPGQRVGVLGMCMTGGLAIAALADPTTGVAVAGQPSLPWPPLLGRRVDLGTDADTLQRAVDSGTPLMAARYERDWMCPTPRMRRVRELFGEDDVVPTSLDEGVELETHDRLRIITVPGRKHAVFTVHASEPAVQAMIRFLRDTLRAEVTPSTD